MDGEIDLLAMLQIPPLLRDYLPPAEPRTAPIVARTQPWRHPNLTNTPGPGVRICCGTAY